MALDLSKIAKQVGNGIGKAITLNPAKIAEDTMKNKKLQDELKKKLLEAKKIEEEKKQKEEQRILSIVKGQAKPTPDEYFALNPTNKHPNAVPEMTANPKLISPLQYNVQETPKQALRFGAGVVDTTANAMNLVGTGANVVANKLGVNHPDFVTQNPVTNYMHNAAQTSRDIAKTNSDVANNVGNFAETLGGIAPSLVTGGSGNVGKVPQFLSFALPSGGVYANQSKAQGLTDEQALAKGLTLGGVNGLIGSANINNISKFMKVNPEGLLNSALTGYGMGALTNASEQGYDKAFIDNSKEIDWNEMNNAGIDMAGMNTLLHTIGTGVKAIENIARNPEYQKMVINLAKDNTGTINPDKLSKIQQAIKDETANIPTETKKMTAEDNAKIDEMINSNNKPTLPKLYKPQNDVKPTLPKIQDKTITEQPKIDLNANMKVTEPTTQNVLKLEPKKAESKFYNNTLKKAEGLQDENIQNYINSIKETHDVKANKETIEKAINRVNSDFDGELKKALDMERNDYTAGAEDITSARFVADKLGEEAAKANTNDAWEGLGKVIKATAGKGLDMGQAIQAFKNWQADTPTGILLKTQRLVNSASEQIRKSNPTLAKMAEEKATQIKDVIEKHKTQTIDDVVNSLDDVIDNVVKQRKPKLPSLNKEVKPKEYIPEEELANKITSHVKEPKAKDIDENAILKDMVNTLYKVAKETPLPEKTKLDIKKKTPIEFIGDAINNKEKYIDVYNKAKETVKSKLVDNIEAVASLDDYFNRIINKGYTNEQLNKAVSAGLKDFNTSIKELVKTAYQSGNFGQKELTRELIKKAGVTGEEATQLGKNIHERLQQLSQEYLDNQIGSIIGEKSKPKPTNPLTKIEEYGNMGLFRNELYQAPAEKLLGSQITKIIKDKGINIGDIAKQGLIAQGEARNKLVFELESKLSLNKKDVNKIIDTATNIFNSKIDAKQRSILAQMTKEYVKSQQKTTIDKIRDFYNLGAFDKADLIPIINEKLGLPTLTADDYKYIYQKAEEINSLPSGDTKNEASWDLQVYIGEKIPQSFTNQFVDLMKMGALSKPSTGLKNQTGNTLYAGLTNIEQPAVGLVDMAVSKLRNSDRQVPVIPSVGAELKGALNGAKRQVGDLFYGAIQENKKSRESGNFAKGIDWKRVFKSINSSNQDTALADVLNEKTIGYKYKNPILRKAEDIRNFIVRDDIGFQAAHDQRIADLQKLKGNKEITPEMEADAVEYAKERVFNNDSTASKIAMAARNIPDTVNNMTGGKVPKPVYFASKVAANKIAPFARTPANFFDRILDYIPPTNIMKLVNEGSKWNSNEFNQRRFSELVVRLGIGTATAYLGAKLYQNKLYNPSISDNEKENAFNSAQNKIPNSIKIGDTSVDVSNYQPISSVLGYGAELARSLENSGIKFTEQSLQQFIKNQINAQYKGMNTMIDASFMQGVNDFIKDANNKNTGLSGAFANSLAEAPNMIIPNSVKGLTASTDAFSRQTYDNNMNLNSILAYLPFFSNNLPVRRNVWGEPIERVSGNNGKPIDPISAEVNPFKTAKEKTDKTIDELNRLYDKTNETEILPKVVDKYVTIQGVNVPLSADEYNKYQAVNGRKIKQMYDKIISNEVIINNIPYSKATDAQKVTILKTVQDWANNGNPKLGISGSTQYTKKLVLERIKKEHPEVYQAIINNYNEKKAKVGSIKNK